MFLTFSKFIHDVSVFSIGPGWHKDTLIAHLCIQEGDTRGFHKDAIKHAPLQWLFNI